MYMCGVREKFACIHLACFTAAVQFSFFMKPRASFISTPKSGTHASVSFKNFSYCQLYTVDGPHWKGLTFTGVTYASVQAQGNRVLWISSLQTSYAEHHPTLVL